MIQQQEILKTIQVLTRHGMVFNSTDRQIKNGTLSFYDPMDVQAKGVSDHPDLYTKYSIHLSGYVRRYIFSYYHWKFYGKLYGYQLNKVRKSKGTYFDHNHRILKPGKYLELAEIVLRISTKNRKKQMA